VGAERTIEYRDDPNWQKLNICFPVPTFSDGSLFHHNSTTPAPPLPTARPGTGHGQGQKKNKLYPHKPIFISGPQPELDPDQNQNKQKGISSFLSLGFFQNALLILGQNRKRDKLIFISLEPEKK